MNTKDLMSVQNRPPLYINRQDNENPPERRIFAGIRQISDFRDVKTTLVDYEGNLVSKILLVTVRQTRIRRNSKTAPFYLYQGHRRLKPESFIQDNYPTYQHITT